MKKHLAWILLVVVVLILSTWWLMSDNNSIFGSPLTTKDLDCPNFSTQKEAQAFFELNGGPASDPHRLDQDKDGIACETLP